MQYKKALGGEGKKRNLTGAFLHGLKVKFDARAGEGIVSVGLDE